MIDDFEFDGVSFAAGIDELLAGNASFAVVTGEPSTEQGESGASASAAGFVGDSTPSLGDAGVRAEHFLGDDDDSILPPSLSPSPLLSIAHEAIPAGTAASDAAMASSSTTPKDARKKRARSQARSAATTGEFNAKRIKREPVPSAPAPPTTPVKGVVVVVTAPFRDPTAKARAAAAKEKRKARVAYLHRFIPMWRRPPGYQLPLHEKTAEWQADRRKCVADRDNRRNRVSGPRVGGKFKKAGSEFFSATELPA